MPGLYSITTRVTGENITADIYNADHNVHLENHIPGMIDDYSSDTEQMRSQEDPFPAEALSRASSLAGELTRLRYQLSKVMGKTYWYQDPPTDLSAVSTATPEQVHLKARFFI